jgi:polysaccharide pyruvyl transferase WcaK-like protein
VGSVADYHVGDDAMLFGLLAAAEHAGLQAGWTVVSATPEIAASAAARFGRPAVAGFGFDSCPDQAARQALLAELDALPPGADGPGRELRQALAGSTALIIAGGGNLSRSWPALVYERLAAARLAGRLGVPVVLTGQSIGPGFGAELRPLVAELLGTAARVGVREQFSAALALLLGVPEERIVLGDDDAAVLACLPEVDTGLDAVPNPVPVAEPFVAVTVNDLGEAVLAALAGQLAEHSSRTGAGLVLVPHAGNLTGPADQDVAAAHRVAGAFDARLAALGIDRRAVVVPLPSAGEAVRYCRQAELVISSRYHPVVFAGSCRTPMLFLHQDAYTAQKGIGALARFGMADWRLSVEDAAAGRLLPALTELWQQRGRLAGLLPSGVGERARERLGRLLEGLAAGTIGAAPAGMISARPDSPDWREAALPEFLELAEAGLEAERDAALSEQGALRQHAAEAERYARSLQEQAERHEPYVRSLLHRAEVAEHYAASLLARAEAAEQHASALQAPSGGGDQLPG